MIVTVTGFRVRLDALRQASDGVDGLLSNVHTTPLDRVRLGADIVGDARLTASVDAFLTKWQTGIDLLVRDAGAVAALLHDCVAAYDDVDQAAAGGFVGGAGRDPADS